MTTTKSASWWPPNRPITALEPGRKISWSRTEPFGGTVEWTYEFLPHADGTEVVELYRAL